MLTSLASLVRRRQLNYFDAEHSESDQPHPLQTRVPAFAGDDVVMHRDAERLGDGDDGFRHRDIGLRRRRIAGGMVVQEPIASRIALNTRWISKRW
jgi:hypothetical protein